MNSFRKIIIICLLISFFGFSLFTVFYNTIKIIPEFNEWGVLTDKQKREKIFGDQYTFYQQLNTRTDANAHILFYTDTGMAYYVERYYLYPKKIIYLSDKKEFLKAVASRKYTYVAIYNEDLTLDGYKKIMTLPQSAMHKGVLYKINE